MKLTQNEKSLLVLAVAIVILGGGYVLFQMPSTSGSGAATTTPSLGTTTAAAPTGMQPKVIPVTPTPTTSPAPTGSGPGVTEAVPTISPDAAAFNVTINTQNASVGSTIPQILISLPKNSNGKLIVITLEPISGTKAPSGILLMTPAQTTNNSYSISGLRFTNVTNEQTGEKFDVTPGTYRILTSLWDKNPFPAFGGSVSGNNGIGVRSAPFTITAAK